MMAPRPTSPVMSSVCGGRESSVSPPSVVAPLAIKPPSLSDAQSIPVPTDQQQRLLYQLALAERLRLASAGLAWARPPLLAHQHHHLQEPTAGTLMGGSLMSGLGFPMIGGGLGSVAFGGSVISAAASQMHPSAYPPTHPLYGYRLLDPRMLLPRGPEEPKPQHSYIGLIAMAILSSPDKKLILSDIYQYILDHYPYFRSRGTGWRNSIRHNLSLNDCFMKSGRSANGKGHYWAIHPANIDDFRRGDFRRRRAQRRVRKHMGLAVDDDSEPETLSPPPPHTPTCHEIPTLSNIPRLPTTEVSKHLTRPKRQFDVLSLLAPDVPRHHATNNSQENPSDDLHSSMEVTSTGLLGQNQIHLGSDSRLRVGSDDLHLQIREVSDDSINHHLHMKASCIPLNHSEPNLRGGDEEPPLRVRQGGGGEEAEIVEAEEEEEVEEKCLPIFHNSQKKNPITSVGGDHHGCLPPPPAPPSRESSSPLEYLGAPWHSPTSPLPPLPPPTSSSSISSSSASEIHHNSSTNTATTISVIPPPGSPTHQYPHELVSSPIRSFATNLSQPHVSKPLQNLSSSSAHTLNHIISHSHGPPTLPNPHNINLAAYPSILARTSQPITLTQSSELHSDH